MPKSPKNAPETTPRPPKFSWDWPSWRHLGLTWRYHGPSWAQLAANFAHLAPIFAPTSVEISRKSRHEPQEALQDPPRPCQTSIFLDFRPPKPPFSSIFYPARPHFWTPTPPIFKYIGPSSTSPNQYSNPPSTLYLTKSNNPINTLHASTVADVANHLGWSLYYLQS